VLAIHRKVTPERQPRLQFGPRCAYTLPHALTSVTVRVPLIAEMLWIWMCF
jgi:hypothetical protein